MNIDVTRGYARAMQRIAAGGDVDAESRSASDDIIEFKRRIISEFYGFYKTKVVPEARAAIAKYSQGGRQLIASDPEHLLKAEAEPLLLLGADEITVSLPRAFEELGLVPMVVAQLQRIARSRVAVTRTGADTSGAAGHDAAMKGVDKLHDRLKEYERLARDLLDVRNRLPEKEQAEAARFAEYFNGLYIATDDRGTANVYEHGTNKQAADLDKRVNDAKALIRGG
jgi:hypothetical protein